MRTKAFTSVVWRGSATRQTSKSQAARTTEGLAAGEGEARKGKNAGGDAEVSIAKQGRRGRVGVWGRLCYK
jgi:hypothetical protein